MKNFIIALLIICMSAIPAFAEFGSKGQIPNGAPVEYRGLKITSEGVNIMIVNKGDKTVRFSAACAFIDAKRNEVGDFFIEETTLEPNGNKQLVKLLLKGDAKLCRKAESLQWTIYTLEEK